VATLVLAAIALTWLLVSWIRWAPLDNTGIFGRGAERTSTAYAFELQNTGRFEIRVTAIDLAPVPGYLSKPLVEVGEAGAYPGDIGVSRHAFEPFSLAPGDQRAIILSGRTSCAPTRRGQAATRDWIRVHYTALWVPRTQVVALGEWQLNPDRDVCDPPPPPRPPVFPDPTNSRL
jgi:hypothetical protein